MALGMEVGLGPGHIVLDMGTQLFLSRKGVTDPSPIFGHVYFGSRCHLVRRQALTQATLCYMEIKLPQKGAQPPTFPPMFIMAKRSPISATAEHLLYNETLQQTFRPVLSKLSKRR